MAAMPKTATTAATAVRVTVMAATVVNVENAVTAHHVMLVPLTRHSKPPCLKKLKQRLLPK